METAIDTKIVSRIHKLLALARDGGATEGEANNAMAMAQKIMLENNLSMATVEATGGEVDEKRVKDEAKGISKNRSWAQYGWQRELMTQISIVNFCYVSLQYGRTTGGGWKGKHRVIGYNLIGREGNVIATKEMFTYLMTTINRLLLEHNGGDHRQNMSRYSLSWKEGCADRLRERLQERHDAAIKEQKREANERNAAARHPAAASTGTALVVVLEDYAQAEEDANRDLRLNLKPGTTARQRAEMAAQEAREAAALAERLAEAKAAGATERELAAMRTYGNTLEGARAFIEQIDNPEEDTRTEKQKAKDAERERKQQERWDRAYYNRRAKERSRLDDTGYRAGVAAADKIGLDKQVTDHKGSKLT